jgi:hypothetical protein
VESPPLAKPKWQYKSEDALGQRERDAQNEDRSSSGGIELVCVRCASVITSTASAIEIGGLHEYTQVNPGGFVWNFRCFSTAPGCSPVGNPSSQFSWFAGYTWQVEHCSRCALHLGWRFAGTDDSFHGLITERLVEARRSDGYS